jgi:CheY-like chemotaxis protein
LALLAGRKLLLADDSITIQKVVALTFADEGVEVVTVSNGHEAIERLKEVTPDVVLADVFMPEINGYEVCRHIKQNAKLQHIPVMLLVGSFEPFDEAEARRVGADDILTKPFQSIRRLIDKVGDLVVSKPAREATTAELPHVEKEPVEPEKLSTEELEITTADTMRFPMTGKPSNFADYKPAPKSPVEPRAYEPLIETQDAHDYKEKNLQENNIMESSSDELRNESMPDSGDVLLDLGDIRRTSAASDDFVLDLDFDEGQAQPFEAAAVSGTHSFAEPQLSQQGGAGQDAGSTAWMDTSELAYRQQGLSSSSKGSERGTDQKFVDTKGWKRDSSRTTSESLKSKGRSELERITDDATLGVRSGASSGSVSLDQLSPEVIDAIARRAVEHLSARVVQEIAWEVVPQLAELLIKRKLEEKQSQSK